MEPALSIIVPSFNRRKLLGNLLLALSRQDADPASFEVVVVLDGSTDGSAEFLANVATPFKLTVLSIPNGGAGAARNAGVAVAAGRYCLFLDDDVTPVPGLVTEHLAAQRKSGGVLAMGAITTRVAHRGFPNSTNHFWAEYGRRRRAGIPLTAHDCFTGNLSVPLAAVRAVGGFDPTLARAEDIELALRLVQSGLSIVYLSAARVTHHYQKSTVQILRDGRVGGRAAARILEKHPQTAASHYVTNTAQRDPVYAELVRLAVRVRVPEPLLAAVGTLPPRLPGANLLFGFMRTQAHMSGARDAISETATWDGLTTGVRILAYHAFAAEGEAPSRFVATERAFREQLAWLRHWANIVPLSKYLPMRAQGILPPRFTVAITVDDGYSEVETIAAPVLAELNVPWTLFAVGALPVENRWDVLPPLGRRPLLSASSLRALAESGVEIGTHGDAHRRLRGLTRPELETEILTARERLRAALGRDLSLFAYAFGESDSAARIAVQEAGYTAAFGVAHCDGTAGLVVGPRSDTFALPRIEVDGRLPLWQFKNLVRWGRAMPVGPLAPALRARH